MGESRLIPNGVAEDPRSVEQKAQDYQSDEALGMAAIPSFTWKEKHDSEWKKLGKREQLTSSSCGGQAGAKADTHFTGETMSAVIYRMRKNYPGEGMYLQDIGDILKKRGTTTEAVCASQNMTEAQMNSIVVPDNLPAKISAYYFLPIASVLNMDLLAEASEKGHPLIILTAFKNSEWRGVPTINDSQEPLYGHFVTVIPGNYTLYSGEKAVIIDDSTGNWSTINDAGQRILTETWLKKRCNGIMALIPEKVVEKPTFVFLQNMQEGYVGSEVKKLQIALKYFGFFKVEPTGTYGPITKKAVSDFQLAHKDKILSPLGLSKPTGRFYEMTRKCMNELLKS